MSLANVGTEDPRALTDSGFFIGAHKVFGSVGAALPKTIDDVRIYNRALSAAEVLQLYKLGQCEVDPGFRTIG